MTAAQISFLRKLSGHRGVFACYKSETAWTMPDNSVMDITRAEVEEIERLGYISGSPEWWVARITDGGLAALANGQTTTGEIG